MGRTFAVLGGIAAVVLLLISVVISANNRAVDAEEGIRASHDQSRNVLAQYAPKINDALGVTTVQADALEKLFKSSNEARYGENGSNATAQFINEQNPSLDQSNYGKVIEMIEAGRNEFQAAQTDKLDKVRVYRKTLRSFPGSMIYGFLGFPQDTDDGVPFFKAYGEIVVSGHADKAFKSGIDDGLGIGKPTAK